MVNRRVVMVLLLMGCKLPISECFFRCENGHCAGEFVCGQDGYCHGDGKITGCGVSIVDGGTDGGSTCVGCVDPNGGPYNYVFVTSTTYVPGQEFVGLAGADAKCAERASAGGLPGTFKAWLSTSTLNARDRFPSWRGWIRPDKRPFADSMSSLLDQGQVFYPPRIDEFGNDLVGSQELAATGTTPGGTKDANTANDWTKGTGYAAGVPAWTTGYWSGDSQRAGGLAARLYCFGANYNRPLSPVRAQGRIAFLSAQAFVPSSLKAADDQCTGDATSHGLPGTFLALLATQSASASARFDLTGPNWVRLDGMPWLENAGDLAQTKLLTALNVMLDKTFQSDILGWGGAPDFSSSAVNDAENCANWTSATQTGTVGRSSASDGAFFNALSDDCGSDAPHLYCLQN